jgi:glycosyltransferase involved in cell wall biosynthesis
MKKQSIVIASILKPVDDTRMFEKMGQSLASNDWHVHIIGYPTKKTLSFPNITFHSLRNFTRISIGRVRAPFSVFKKLLAIKPTVVIIGTHELLVTAAIYKIIFKARLIYDVRENYFLNILSTHAFPKGIRHAIAFEVRFREWLTSPFISHYLLAEKSYKDELPFIGKKSIVIENKCKVPPNFKRAPPENGIRLLFSGTLDESTGIFETIELVKKMRCINPEVTLTIIGHCALPLSRKKILLATETCPFISVIGLDTLVPHSKIIEEIASTSAGIIFYPKSRHNQNCVPTKLFEYLAFGLPFIYDEDASWKHLADKSPHSIPIDFRSPNVADILKRLSEKTAVTEPAGDMTWQSEEGKFLGVLNSCLISPSR